MGHAAPSYNAWNSPVWQKIDNTLTFEPYNWKCSTISEVIAYLKFNNIAVKYTQKCSQITSLSYETETVLVYIVYFPTFIYQCIFTYQCCIKVYLLNSVVSSIYQIQMDKITHTRYISKYGKLLACEIIFFLLNVIEWS